jgi:hypothetical protein
VNRSVAESLITQPELDLAEHWFGYGHWDAPYWFIGLEPGGSELDACLRAWKAAGKPELLDLKTGHAGHKLDWFSDAAGTQPTWAKLIWLLLAYKDQEPTAAATRQYQKQKLGRSAGETALLELSCLPAENNGVPVARDLFRNERIATIRERLSQHAPRFVVFYSPDPRYRSAWNEIAGTPLERDTPVTVGSTTFVVTYHPNGEWSKVYWVSAGQKLRNNVLRLMP